MLVPLAIINHFKPTRQLNNNVDLDELYPEGLHERDLALPPDPEKLTWRNFFLWLDRVHKFAEWFAENGIHPFRKRALKKAEQWMLERFEGSDGLAAIFPAMLNSLIALKALGYPDDHPQVLRAEKELKKLEHETEHTVRIGAFDDVSVVRFTANRDLVLVTEGASLSDWMLGRPRARVSTFRYVRSGSSACTCGSTSW